jgi:hypothetical protein
MKYIKNINQFDLVMENIDIYDFGRKNGNLDQYYKDASELAQEFPIELIDELELKLPAFDIQYFYINTEPYVYIELKGFFDNFWIIQYYGDYCYGIFRWDTDGSYNGDIDEGDLDWVEFCDDIEPVLTRLNRNKKLILGE